MIVRATTVLAALAGCASSVLAGGLPDEWSFQLVAIENNAGNAAVNMPTGASLLSPDPMIDEQGNVAFRYSQGEDFGIVYWNAATGVGSTIVNGDFSSSMDNLGGRVAVQDFSGNFINVYTPTGALINEFGTGGTSGVSGGLSRPRLTSDGWVAFRANTGATVSFLLERFDGATRESRVLVSTADGFASLGSGSINDNKQGALRVTRSDNTAAILRLTPNATPEMGYTREVVEEFTAPFNQVSSNSADINNAGQVAYFRKATAASPWQLVRAGAGSERTVIATGDTDFGDGRSIANNEFANFATVISNSGMVAFNPRRIMNGGSGALAESIWAGDGTRLSRVVIAEQFIQIEGIEGGVSLAVGDAISGNAISINGQNQIAFVAKLSDGRDAVLVASPRVVACGLADVAGGGQVPGADGELTADDIIVFIGFFFASDARADVAGPGQVVGADGEFTADDIIVFIGAFFAGC